MGIAQSRSEARPDRLLRYAEVEERLAIKSTQLWRLVSSGELAVVKIGAREVRIPESEVTAFIERHRTVRKPSK